MAMIVSDAFMKRSFGKKLIENFLRNLDLTHIISTSGVYLPGHGTPTVILIARHQPPIANTVRAVRGIRGETGIPDDPADAPVWREIADNVDQPGFEGNYVSIANAARASFDAHPWAIGGGGAAELKQSIDDNAECELLTVSTSIGITSFTLEDDAFQIDAAVSNRFGFKSYEVRTLVVGEMLRDWLAFDGGILNLFPYDKEFKPLEESDSSLFRFLWPSRTRLSRNVMFGGKTKVQTGLKWYEYGRLTAHKLKTPFSITFGFVATHNQFILDQGNKIFNRSAPVVKLPIDASAEDHIDLLGLLNSSTMCFWLKQVCFPKGGDHVGVEGARIRKTPWDIYYEFDATQIGRAPITNERPSLIARSIQAESVALTNCLPTRLFSTTTPSYELLVSAKGRLSNHLGRMIALQEELDWQCYRLYGIIEDDLTLSVDQVPHLNLGERAFEIVLARANEEPLWFERHHSTPITEVPSHWPEAYRNLVERRIALIESNRDIALIERPEYKRRWNLPSWQEMESAALKSWLLDRMEANPIWHEHRLVSCAQLRDALAQDRDWVSVADIYKGNPIADMEDFVLRLAIPEAVPYLPVLRYTETGLRKRAEWEEVWKLQREEDAGQQVEIPVPPKYVTKDFQKADYWRLRGGLDVPKERFILYASMERDSDRTPVLGWAGWSHLEQAQALATYYQRMRTEEGWEPERLKPVLAGVLDLKPWLLQWHNDIDPETGERLGAYFSHFAESQCQELGFSPEEVRAWQPVSTSGAGRRGRRRSQ
jgi:hypothetical protein